MVGSDCVDDGICLWYAQVKRESCIQFKDKKIKGFCLNCRRLRVEPDSVITAEKEKPNVQINPFQTLQRAVIIDASLFLSKLVTSEDALQPIQQVTFVRF